MENEINKISQFELTPDEIKFVQIYTEFNNLTAVKNYLGWSNDDVINMYKDPKVRDAILYWKNQRLVKIYNRKMLSLEELGSYLSNQITDYDVTIDNHFSPREKLEASKLLLDVHKTINSASLSPSQLETYDLKFNPSDLDVDQIKDLLKKVDPQSKEERELNVPIEEDPLIVEVMYLETEAVIAERKRILEQSKEEIHKKLKKLKDTKYE